MNWQEFLAMGGHAFYVWGSFGMVALVMVANWLVPLWQHRRLLAELERQVRRRQERNG